MTRRCLIVESNSCLHRLCRPGKLCYEESYHRPTALPYRTIEPVNPGKVNLLFTPNFHDLSTVTPQLIQEFLHSEELPATYGADVLTWFLPFAQELLLLVTSNQNNPMFIGINGAQGTGKSTLAKLFKLCCTEAGLKVAVLSIDDFYLSKHARAQLAETVHPLLATRGVPGTHDVEKLKSCLNQLLDSQVGTVKIPRFDKAADNPAPEDRWATLTLPVDLIILEGWFIGLEPEPCEHLVSPVNHLEVSEDGDGSWRNFVNNSLRSDFADLFGRLDSLLMLQAPSFEQVLTWRSLQEEKLKRHRAALFDADTSGVMNSEEIGRFIQHFERLTRHALNTLPQKADWVFHLDSQHRVAGKTCK